MSKKGLVRGFALSMMVAAGVSVLFSSSAYADTNSLENTDSLVVYSSAGGQNDTMGTKLEWYYKKENGKTYRRLYDATNEVWLTDWIPC